MRRFRFRLERVLALRAAIVRERELELGSIAGREAVYRARIAELITAKERALGPAAAAGPRDEIEFLRLTEAYGVALACRADQLRQEMQPVVEARRAAAERYTAARRDADVLERVRDRRLAHHAKQRARDGRHALDEIAMYLHRARSDDGSL